MLDVRYPIGYLFLILGIILAGYGYANPATFNTAGGPLPLNIDVPWGILMFLFGTNFEQRNSRNRGKGFTSEPQSHNTMQILDGSDLAGSVSFDSKWQIICRHTFAIINNMDERFSCLMNNNGNTCCSGINSVLDKFFDN